MKRLSCHFPCSDSRLWNSPGRGFRRPFLHTIFRSLVAFIGGYLIYLSFPPSGFWWAAPIGIACGVGSILCGRRSETTSGKASVKIRSGLGLGYLLGLGFFLPLLPWVGEFVGALPWIALAAFLSCYCALFGAMVVPLRRLSWHPFPLAPLAIACAWSITEALRSILPFGGFPWGRLAFAQVNGPLVLLASLGGAPLVSLTVALLGAVLLGILHALQDIWNFQCGQRASLRGNNLAESLEHKSSECIRSNHKSLLGESPESKSPLNSSEGNGKRSAKKSFLLRYGGSLFGIAGLLALPAIGVTAANVAANDANDSSDTITVAAIQGNVPQPGLDFNAIRMQVLANHVRMTKQLARDVASGKVGQPDIVIWPENSSDIDPLENPIAGQMINEAQQAIHAPILVGTVRGRAPDEVSSGDNESYNVTIVWDSEGPTGEEHIKKYIQPFGEYLPYRDFFRRFSSYADRAGNFVPGDGTGVVSAKGIRIGVATCYEVAFDAALRDATLHGAQFLTVPTNNATFGYTDMTYQQLAMSQVRAVEHRRAIVVAATSGASAIISPDGRVEQSTGIFTPDYLVASIPLRTDLTPATRLGSWPEIAICLIGIFLTLQACRYDWLVRINRRDR